MGFSPLARKKKLNKIAIKNKILQVKETVNNGILIQNQEIHDTF